MITSFLPLIVSTALGQDSPTILPEVAPVGLPEAYAESRRAAGFSGSKTEPMCVSLVEELLVCFRIQREGRLEWLSKGDLSELGLLEEEFPGIVGEAAYPNPLVKKNVPGGGEWWQVEAEKGLQDLLFLRPHWLDRVGEGAVVSIPAHGVVLAWKSGDAENDQIMAVGVRRIFEQADFPLSPKILRYSEGAWVVWGEAVLPQTTGG
jgi:hypothetical protein